MEARPSFYSACIGSFETICLAAGIGIAVGMFSGTTGLEGAARGRMTLLAVVIGLAFGYFAAAVFDGVTLLAMISSALFAGLSCAVFSGVIAGATRRGGTAALTFITIIVALVIAVASMVFPPIAILPAIAIVWLAISRNRRADRKHAGLRVLR